MTGVVLKFDRKVSERLRRKVEGHLLHVGVLENRPHRAPVPGSAKSVAGGPARRLGKASGVTVEEVSRFARLRLLMNFYRRPFRGAGQNRDIVAFSKAFFKMALRDENPNRARNLLQAIVRNPILRGDYGRNSQTAAKAKGFNRLLIDTGQLFKAIRAQVRVKRVP